MDFIEAIRKTVGHVKAWTEQTFATKEEIKNLSGVTVVNESFAYLGSNPIASTSEDTIAKWLELGSGYAWFNVADRLTNQPYTYGMLLNYVTDYEVTQVWIGLRDEIYHRSGNTSGFSSWYKLIDTRTSDIMEQRIADLEAAIADINYKEISISSFSANPSTAEIGRTIESVALSWKLSKTPLSLSLNGSAITDVTTTSKTVTGPFTHTSSGSWTLKATDERGSVATRTTGLTFYKGLYYGVAAEPSEYTSEFFIENLTKSLRSGKLTSFTVNAATDQYIYYFLPVSFGACAFKVGGFDGGFTLINESFSFTNSYGYTENYRLYRSDNSGLGSTSVSVS